MIASVGEPAFYQRPQGRLAGSMVVEETMPGAGVDLDVVRYLAGGQDLLQLGGGFGERAVPGAVTGDETMPGAGVDLDVVRYLAGVRTCSSWAGALASERSLAP